MSNKPDEGLLSYLSRPKNRPVLVVLLLGILINVAGITTKFFTDDPGLYALIARNMARSNDFVDLTFQGHDWLDKPHFPFWMIALSFKVFGINTVAYKIPALFFYYLSVVYTYLFVKKVYNADMALIAALVLLTAQHAIMSNTDVRAEPYIMGLLMGSVYHFYGLKYRFNLRDLLLASLFAACAVMTKGIYVLIPIGGGIIGDYVFKGEFKGLFHWKWYLAILLVAVFTLPEIYTLYVQFDLHPEKVVFGHRGVSGIHWFLWDSQFGRFNSTGYIKRTDGSVFFFLHTLLWAFAPWAFLLYYALFSSIKKIVRRVPLQEYVSLCGALLMLAIFSISQFQLPFYTNILFPYFAIITSAFIYQVIEKNRDKFFSIAQYIVVSALVVIIVFLNFIFAPGYWLVFTALSLGLLKITYYIFNKTGSVYRSLFLLTCCVAVYVNAYFTWVVYPILLSYKGDVQAAAYINYYYPKGPVVLTCDIPNAFPFYIEQPINIMAMSKVMKWKPKNAIILVEDSILSNLQKARVPYCIIKAFDNYPNEVLTKPFLSKKTRPKSLNHFFLIKLDDEKH